MDALYNKCLLSSRSAYVCVRRNKIFVCLIFWTLASFVYVQNHLGYPDKLPVGPTARYTAVNKSCNDSNILASKKQHTLTYLTTKQNQAFITTNHNHAYVTTKYLTSKHNQSYKNNTVYIPRDTEDEFCRQKRFLVHVCSRGTSSLCGGYGDRQRGIVTSYLLAQMLGREFAVMHDRPCPLTDFLDYNIYNWFRCNGHFKPSSVHRHIDDHKFKTQIPDYNFTEKYRNKEEYISTNRNWEKEILARPEAYERLGEFQNKSHAEIVHIVLERLFRPKAELEEDINTFLKKYQTFRKLVCAHIRVYENRLHTDVDQFANVNEGMYIKTVTNFLKNYTQTGNYSIFIASNSAEVKTYVQRNIGKDIITFSERIKNVDSTSKCKELRLALLEQIILSKCDTLVITFSGFGMNSAYMRKSDGELYCPYGPNKEVHRCSYEDVYREYELHK